MFVRGRCQSSIYTNASIQGSLLNATQSITLPLLTFHLTIVHPAGISLLDKHCTCTRVSWNKLQFLKPNYIQWPIVAAHGLRQEAAVYLSSDIFLLLSAFRLWAVCATVAFLCMRPHGPSSAPLCSTRITKFSHHWPFLVHQLSYFKLLLVGTNNCILETPHKLSSLLLGGSEISKSWISPILWLGPVFLLTTASRTDFLPNMLYHLGTTLRNNQIYSLVSVVLMFDHLVIFVCSYKTKLNKKNM